MNPPDPRVQKILALFERLGPADLPRLPEIYTPDAHFKDPFNEVRGVTAITRIFEHMFKALEAPRFVIRDTIVQGDQCFLSWDFVFRMQRFSGAEQVIHGASHLHLAADGRIRLHRDYWDAAEELYEKLPMLGALMRWLKRRVNA
jgi:ketosteroid isomerase-like protein